MVEWSTSQYHFVPQSLHKARSRTTLHCGCDQWARAVCAPSAPSAPNTLAAHRVHRAYLQRTKCTEYTECTEYTFRCLSLYCLSTYLSIYPEMWWDVLGALPWVIREEMPLQGKPELPWQDFKHPKLQKWWVSAIFNEIYFIVRICVMLLNKWFFSVLFSQWVKLVNLCFYWGEQTHNV